MSYRPQHELEARLALEAPECAVYKLGRYVNVTAQPLRWARRLMTGTVQMHACAFRHPTWLRAPFQSRYPPQPHYSSSPDVTNILPSRLLHLQSAQAKSWGVSSRSFNSCTSRCRTSARTRLGNASCKVCSDYLLAHSTVASD